MPHDLRVWEKEAREMLDSAGLPHYVVSAMAASLMAVYEVTAEGKHKFVAELVTSPDSQEHTEIYPYKVGSKDMERLSGPKKSFHRAFSDVIAHLKVLNVDRAAREKLLAELKSAYEDADRAWNSWNDAFQHAGTPAQVSELRQMYAEASEMLRKVVEKCKSGGIEVHAAMRLHMSRKRDDVLHPS